MNLRGCWHVVETQKIQLADLCAFGRCSFPIVARLGTWFLDFKSVSDTMWNFAPWPFGIPLGAYMLCRAYKSEDEILAAAATPFLTPYIAPYSVTIVLALVGSKYRREAFFVYVGFWIYFVVEARRLALMG